jgi:hypothetical protein
MSIQRVTLSISDFGCASSSAMIAERTLAQVPDVVRVYVNPATEMGTSTMTSNSAAQSN